MTTSAAQQETVRCRLYQSRHELRPGRRHVTQVYDTLEELEEVDFKDKRDLKHTFTGNSLEEVREQVRDALAEMGNPPTSTWNHRGMI